MASPEELIRQLHASDLKKESKKLSEKYSKKQKMWKSTAEARKRGVKTNIVSKQTGKDIFGRLKGPKIFDALKQKNKELLAKSNSAIIKNKKLSKFLTSLGIKVSNKDYKNRKYDQAAKAAQRRGEELTKLYKAQAKKKKAATATTAQQNRGASQTEYYKKKMIPYYLREESKRLEKRQAEAKREQARRRNAEKRLAEYERSYNKKLPGLSYAPKTTKKKKKSSGNSWKKNLGIK